MVEFLNKKLRKEALLSLWYDYETQLDLDHNERYAAFNRVIQKSVDENLLSFEDRDALEGGLFIYFEVLLDFVCDCEFLHMEL